MSQTHENPPEPIDFSRASAVEGSERHFVADVHPSWDGPLTTHGGLLQAIALNAIDAEINPDGAFQPRSITCHYLRPPQHGRVDIFVDPLRRGRRFASTRATISQNGKPSISVLATHSARDLAEIDHWALSPPETAPAPARDAQRISPEAFAAGEQGGWVDFPAEAPQFFQRLLFSPRFGDGPYVGPPVDPAVGTTNGGWITTPEPRPIDAAWLAVLVDGLWPSILQPLRTPAMAPTLDLTTHIRGSIPREGLPDQPLLVHNVSRAVQGGLADSDSFIFAQDGTLLAQGRQLQLLQPLQL